MNNNLTKVERIVIIVTVVAVFIVFGGIGYAFFTMNNSIGSTALVTSSSGRMIINYADGSSNLLVSEKITPSNIIIVNKTFSLTGVNTTNGMNMAYNIGLKYTSSFSYGQLHYYFKRIDTNSNITSNLIGTANQTIPGNTSETGYTSGIFIKSQTENYLELANGEFKPSQNNQTITFNLKMQFPDTGKNQDAEKGATFTGQIVVNYEDSLENIAMGFDYLSPTDENPEPYYTFIAPKTGTYKLETWGAQGGGYNNNGGYGGYSTGFLNLQINQKIFIYVGGTGQQIYSYNASSQGGYNGGGSSLSNSDTKWGGGGGATHIAINNGLLSNLSNNLSAILIVSGGGGGGGQWKNQNNYGGAGGGATGNNGIGEAPGFGATQNNGGNGNSNNNLSGSFGMGGGNITNLASGGGGGLYGGGTGYTHGSSAGGGSGYIGNSLLINKAMYCYNCTESSETATKTISTICHEENPTSNCAKEGNGYARITLISD